MKNVIKALVVTAMVVSLPVAADHHGQKKYGMQHDSADIVEVAVANGSFTTLVKAVQVAGLVETLKGEGPFTVFAPTDEAFARVPADVLNGLLADKQALANVLTYHVVPGKVLAKDVANLTEAATVQGGSVGITVRNGTVFIDDAQVLLTDVAASNGVIHVIDAVILPSAASTD